MKERKQEYIDENRSRKAQHGAWTEQLLLCVYCGKEIEWNPCCGHPQCKDCKAEEDALFEAKKKKAQQKELTVWPFEE